LATSASVKLVVVTVPMRVFPKLQPAWPSVRKTQYLEAFGTAVHERAT
jgi:hypothetical protein